jgi:hypothetical protein
MPDFPRITATVDPAVIWTYSTRTLTGFTGTPRSDLIGADESLDAHGYTTLRAGKLDNLDVAVSTRSSHTVADIWGYATRTLTGLTGQPRIDLLGEDASFEAGTGTRKSVLDKLLAPTSPIENTITADGTEQTLTDQTGTLEFQLDGFVDLTNMASGDTVVIREYMKIKSGGDYVKYAEETYSGAQSIPLLHILTKPSRYGLKITLQQTAGTYRSFDYQFFKRIRTA